MSFIKYILSFCLLIPPFILKAQDTLFYPNSRSIQFITVVNGAAKTVTGFHRDGSKASVQHYVNDTLHGMVQRWYPSGYLSEESVYEMGIQVSRKTWDTQQKPALTEHYEIVDSTRQRRLHGPYATRNNGLPLIEGNYQHGKKHGQWKSFYNTGTLRAIENVSNGLLEGKATYYHTNGLVARISRYTLLEKEGKPVSVLHGRQVIYNQDGTLSEKATFLEGKKHGKYTSWYPSGQLKEQAVFTDGAYDGKVKRWFQDGILQVEYTMKYSPDTSGLPAGRSVYEGTYKQYYPDGYLKTEANYREGKYHGVKREYKANGVLYSEEFYEEGLKSGIATYWSGENTILSQSGYKIIADSLGKRSVNHGRFFRNNQDGTPSIEGSYVDGLKHGLWKEWHRNGQPASEKNFCFDKLCGSYKTWYENGQLTTVREYGNITDHKGEFLPTGVEINYFQNGLTSQTTYYDILSRPHFRRSFYPDGTIESEEWNLVSNQIGETTIILDRKTNWFPNGRLEADLFGSRYHYGAGRNMTWYINGKPKAVTDLNLNRAKNGLEIIYGSDGSVLYFKDHQGNRIDTAIARDLYTRYSGAPGLTESYLTADSILIRRTYYEEQIPALVHGTSNHLTQGDFLAFYADGDTLVAAHFDQGVPHGSFRYNYPGGTPYMVGDFIHGSVSGNWKVYYENGIQAEDITYQQDTNLIGIYKSWYENGNQKKIYSRNGDKTEGLLAEYYNNGQPRFIWNYNNGMQEGLQKEFWEDGKQSREYYAEKGVKQGSYKEWYKNGNRRVETGYVDGKQDGTYRYWWENGNLRMEGAHRLDRMDSIWTYYTQDGEFKERRLYRHGNLVLTPSEIPCSCVDSTSGKISYAPPLNSLAELDLVRKMSYNFHAPVDSFYNDLFYINMFADNSRDAISYSMNVVAFEPVYLEIPARNGLKLIFNPCPSVAGHGNRIPLYLYAQTDDKSSLSVQFNPEYAAFEFNPALLHPWDERSGKPFGGDSLVPSQVQFKVEGISYNSREHIRLEKISEGCFPLSEIGDSKVLVEFNTFTPDLDLKRNPFELQSAVGLYEGKFNKNFNFGADDFLFTGLYIPHGKFKILEIGPDSKSIDGEIVQALFANHYIVGTFSIKSKPGQGLYYESVNSEGETVSFTTDQLSRRLRQSGFEVADITYDAEASALIIYLSFIKW